MQTKLLGRILLVFTIMLLVGALPLSAQDDGEVQEIGAGEIEINFWSGLGGPDGESMTGLVQGFTDANPDVSINYQILGWGVFFDKLSAAIVAGSGGPDLMTLWHSVVPQYALPGHIMTAGEVMFDTGMLDQDDFSPALLDSISFDGEVYSVHLITMARAFMSIPTCWNAPVSRSMIHRRTKKSSWSMCAD